jgi:hypothetical protein
MAGVGGAAVSGRLSLAGTEARPTELSLDEIIGSNTKGGFETRPDNPPYSDSMAPTK